MPKKQTIVKARRPFFIAYHTFLLIAVFVLSAVALNQNHINKIGAVNDLNQVVSQANNMTVKSVPVDFTTKQAFVPELNIRMPYNAETMSLLSYRPNVFGEKDDERTAMFGEPSQTSSRAYNYDGEINKDCTMPFLVSINKDAADEYTNVSTATLADGRKLSVLTSNAGSCQGYISSVTGQEVLASLKTLQSY